MIEKVILDVKQLINRGCENEENFLQIIINILIILKRKFI